jgi:hypothetical protein
MSSGSRDLTRSNTQGNGGDSKGAGPKSSKSLANDIVEVYDENFFEEITKMAELSTEFNYVAMVGLPPLRLMIVAFRILSSPAMSLKVTLK